MIKRTYAPLKRQIQQVTHWIKQRRFQLATRALQRLHNRYPRHAQLYYQSGRLAEAQGQDSLAIKSYTQAVALNSQLAPAHYQLGFLHDKHNNFGLSISAFGRYLQLRPKTRSSKVYMQLALVFSRFKHEGTAVQFYLKALEHENVDPLVYFLLAQTLDQLGDLDLALKSLMTLGELYNARLDLLALMMGYLLERQGEYQTALNCYDEAIERNPHQILWQLKRDLTYPLIPDSHAEIEAVRVRMEQGLDRVLERLQHQPIQIARNQFFYLTMMHGNAVYTSYHHYSPLQLRTQLAQVTERVMPKPLAFEPAPLAQDQRIHLGIFSADKSLALTYVYAGAMAEGLDPARFRVTVFSTSPEITLLFKPESKYHFSQPHVSWRLISDNIYEALKQIRASHLQAMFFTEPGWDFRQYMLAMFRVAPVQCTSWMNPGTTGLKQMDYYLSAEAMEVPGAESHYIEKLERWSSFPSSVPAVSFPEPVARSEFGLADSDHLYLCLQNLLKLHPDFDQLLAGILRADPQGQIILLSGKGERLAQKMTQRFQRHMPELMDRIWVFPELDNVQFLNLLQVGDVMLDPLYYGGGTTTYQALAWGIPLVTLPTERMVGQITAALCRRLDYAEGIVDSPEAYIETAVALACDPERRMVIQERLRTNAHRIFEDPQASVCLAEFLERTLVVGHSKSGLNQD